jgi:hypothetical protein
MNRFRSFTLIAVIAALVATGMAYAQGPGAGGPRGRGPDGPGGDGSDAFTLYDQAYSQMLQEADSNSTILNRMATELTDKE